MMVTTRRSARRLAWRSAITTLAAATAVRTRRFQSRTFAWNAASSGGSFAAALRLPRGGPAPWQFFPQLGPRLARRSAFALRASADRSAR